jgi:hypothetical protein
MSEIKVGDEVRVFDRTRGRHIVERPGEVVKVGRTLLTIAYGGNKPYPREAKFRMDTGRINDNYGGVWFKTPEQTAAEECAERATKVLREAGLEIRPGHRPADVLLEALAAVVSLPLDEAEKLIALLGAKTGQED